MFLEAIWLVLAFIHIIPLSIYILYMKFVAEKKIWNIRIDANYEPFISIIIPTYEEATIIEKKLDNLRMVEYPREKLEIIVIDSASGDETYEKASNWVQEHSDIKFKLLKELERTGKSHALNLALRHAKGEIICISDAEALWPPDTLRRAVKYMVDPIIGAVTGIHEITGIKKSQVVEIEKTYRKIYTSLSIGESKLHSTPIFEGELALYKKEFLNSFPEDIGADDTGAALDIIKKGYRSIAVPDAIFFEPTPYTWNERFTQKVRRGQHIIQAFNKYKKLMFNGSTVFHNLIFPMRIFIYVVNPIVGLFFFALTLPVVLNHRYLLVLTIVLVIPQIREMLLTHFTNTMIMILAIFNEIIGRKKLVWTKVKETRSV